MGLRTELAAHLRSELGDGIVVYDAGVDLVAVPCVVINPAPVYVQPASFGISPTVEVMFELHLVTNRTEPSVAVGVLEDLRLQVTDAIKTMTPAGFWSAFGDLAATNVGGTLYGSAVVEVRFKDSDRGNTLP